MNFCITGSEGFIGSNLCAELYRRGHEVHGMDVRAEGREDVDISCDEIDFTGFDGVFHLAAVAGVVSWGRVFEHYARVNVLGTQRVFEAAAEAGVPVAYASSSSVYGRPKQVPTPESAPLRPLSPYGVSKLAGEHLALAYDLAYDLDVVVLRFFTVYGPGQRSDMLFARAIEAVKTGEPLLLRGDGSQSRGFTYVDDVVEGIIRAFEATGDGPVNIGGHEEVVVNDALALLGEIAGEPVPVSYVPAAPGEETRTCADTSLLRRLDWEPEVPFEEGLRRQWEAACSESS